MPVTYVKMKKDGGWELIQEDRVQRFLDEGWTMVSPETKKRSPRKDSKNKIIVDAQVTSSESEEETVDQWDLNTEEWADSEEAVIDTDETANKEE